MKLLAVYVGGMNTGFCRRQRETQAPVTSVHGAKPEDVAEEEAIGLWLVAVEQYMSAIDPENHGASLSGWDAFFRKSLGLTGLSVPASSRGRSISLDTPFIGHR